MIGATLIFIFITCPLAIEAAGLWSDHEASKRWEMWKDDPVEFNHDDVWEFMQRMYFYLGQMPMPTNESYALVQEENNQVLACLLREEDEDKETANPSDVMRTVLKSFAGGNCARGVVGEWYYQVCGNLEVRRAPFRAMKDKKTGRRVVIPYTAFESLGYLGRNRKVSRHLSHMRNPRYLYQVYEGGSKCSFEGSEYRMNSTVVFKCNKKVEAGKMKIQRVIEYEDFPCEYRLTVASRDFCENEWLSSKMGEYDNKVPCRYYFHPERIAPLMEYFDKYRRELKEKSRRHNEWLLDEEEQLKLQRKYPEYSDPYSEESDSWFELMDTGFCPMAEGERTRRMVDYVISELMWASFHPEIPYTEEEKRLREEEEEEGRRMDRSVMNRLSFVLEKARSREVEKRKEKERKNGAPKKTKSKEKNMEIFEAGWEYATIMPYRELMDYTKPQDLKQFDKDEYLHFYATWLDYIKRAETRVGEEGRDTYIPPRRKPPIHAWLALDRFIKSRHWGMMGDISREMGEPEPKKEEEMSESEIEELMKQFKDVYKSIKDPSDDPLNLFGDDEY